jgi:hypothetical protein
LEDKKEKLVSLIIEHNISAIVTFSEKLDLDREEVIELLNELVAEGRLHGSITDDGTRFFRSDAKVSKAPVIEREEKLPEFLSYNTKPGYIIGLIGIFILIAAGIISTNAVDIAEQNFAAGFFFIGLIILFVGAWLVANRKTPS